MPTPLAGESEKDWMGRCMKRELGEGKAQDQAVAICMSMWRKKSKSNFGEITKTFGEPLEIKADGEKRTVEAYASTFGNVDEVGDRVMPGAFKKTLKEAFPKGYIKVCLNHDKTEPIGVPVHMEEDSKGLFTVSRIARTPLGDKALALIQDGVATRYSIRAGVVKALPAEDHELYGKVTNLHELRLSEYGPVYWAANSEAQIMSVKGLEEELLSTLMGVPARVSALQAALSEASQEDVQMCLQISEALIKAAEDLNALAKGTQKPTEEVTLPMDPEALQAIQSEMAMFRLKLLSYQ